MRRPFDSHKRAPNLNNCHLARLSVYSPNFGALIHRPSPAFPATAIRSSPCRRCDRAGLDMAVDFPRRVAHLARLVERWVQVDSCTRGRGHQQRESRHMVPFNLHSL